MARGKNAHALPPKHREAMKRKPKATRANLAKQARQEDAIEHFMAGKSARQTAKALGISDTTIYSWLASPDFLQKLDTARKALLSGERIRNIEALVHVRDNNPTGMARVSAVNSLEKMMEIDEVKPAPNDRQVPGLVVILPANLVQPLDQRLTIDANPLELQASVTAPHSERALSIEIEAPGARHAAPDDGQAGQAGQAGGRGEGGA